MSELIFNDSERLIFINKENGSDVAYDPSALWRNFRRAQVDLGVNYEELARTYKQVVESEQEEERIAKEEGRDPVIDMAMADLGIDAIRLIGELGRRTFGKEPLAADGSGWTENEGQVALLRYLLWQAELRGKAEASPSGSPPTDGHLAGEANSTTSSTMGSN